MYHLRNPDANCPANSMMNNKLSYNLLILLFIFNPCFSVVAQNADTADVVKTFAGTITLTTKGLSTFPNLTLGKPAAIFDFSAGGEKFRFEPTMRFALKGKPWTFIFWFRYKIVENEKFQLRVGAHPAYSFRTVDVPQSGVSNKVLIVHQYIAGDISPLFFITKNISAGPYYIYSRGVNEDAVQNSNFISFRMNVTGINLTDSYFMHMMAQAYYLKMDANDGFYIFSSLSLNRRDFPVSISSSINKTIESNIPGNDFLWNINLNYSFGWTYRRLSTD
jgi:hypothetical protein